LRCEFSSTHFLQGNDSKCRRQLLNTFLTIVNLPIPAKLYSFNEISPLLISGGATFRLIGSPNSF
jgi:hypothetical protein